MHKIIVTFSFLIALVNAYSQGAIEKKTTLSNKFTFGGSIGIQFGTFTGINISPTVAYKPINNLYLGTKLSYQYYSGLNTSTIIYSTSIYTMYAFGSNLAAYAEYEFLNLDKKLYTANQDGRLWINIPLIGAGFIQPIGQRSKLLLLLLWSFNNSYYSPYTNPVVRVTALF